MKLLILLLFFSWGGVSQGPELKPTFYELQISCMQQLISHCGEISNDCIAVAHQALMDSQFPDGPKERDEASHQVSICFKQNYKCQGDAFNGFCDRWAEKYLKENK